MKLLNKTDIIYIAKDTPTDSKNQSDFSEINRIIRKVRDNVKKQNYSYPFAGLSWFYRKN